MATKSPKKKTIDGVVKPKKGTKAKSDEAEVAKKAKETTSVKDAPFSVSVEDTVLAITTDIPESEKDSAESAEEKSPKGSEKESKDNVAAAIENDSNSAQISEPAIEEDKNLDESPADDEGLVASAILEEDVIDKNLDDLINDIEGQEEEDAKEAEEEAEEVAEEIEEAEEAAEEAEAEAEKADTVANAIAKNTSEEDKAAEKAIKDIEKQEENKPMQKKAKKSKAKSKVDAKPFRIISRIFALIATVSVTALGVRAATTGIFPTKYVALGFVVAAIVLFFILFKAFRNKTRVPMLVFVNLLSIALTAASIFGLGKIDETMAFLNRNFDDGNEYSIYDVVVSKQSNYNNLNDVRGKTFHSISDFVDTKNLEEAAKEQANASISYESGLVTLLDKTLESTTYISVVNSGTYEGALDSDTDKDHKYTNGLKIIGELKVKVDKKAKSSSSLTEESSVIYLSGIDTRSGMMLDRSLSDVNIVITVNPKTKEILMTTIPRDYYVQLHGTSGLPDKLTHAGALGGVQLSMDTIGDLLNVEFNRYIRVNFNFVVNLVDAVGGITVYSDADKDITAWTDSSCVFHPGNNDVDGKCALAFARERYAYSDGDRHRGRNQEQVIEKIFEKVTSSSTLISRYSSILDSLNGSFDTDITTSDITSLVNMQLSDMAKWDVNEYNLDGTSGGAYTYSYPNQQLSVMFPNMETVDAAKQKIQQVLTGTTNN